MSFTVAKNAWCRNIVKGLKFKTVNVSGNGNANFAIDVYSRLWSWGWGNYGQPGQGNPKYDAALSGLARWTVPENRYIVSPRLVALADGTVKEDWVKINVGDYSSMGIDKDGALWGCGYGSSTRIDNCSSFGLPHDSGEDVYEWKDGVEPRENYQEVFFHMTRCAPDHTFKNFAHCYYHTLMIGNDDKLYFMGEDDSYGLDGLPITVDKTYNVPTLVANIPTDIKLIANTAEFNYGMYCFVTSDNKIYGVGEEIWDYYHDGTGDFNPVTDPYVFDITGNLPDVEIVHASAGYTAMFVTLADGTVYGRGGKWYIAQETDSYYEWVKIPIANISYCEHSQIGMFALDHYGNLYSWGLSDFGTGLQVANCFNATAPYYKVIIATKRQWKRVMYNYYNNNWAGIDIHGNLRAWGSQLWGPMLGIGTTDSVLYNDWLGIEDREPVRESCTPLLCEIPDQSSIAFHWPRATHTPTPDYYER
jgi:alpha-tubulin suppressor-like RCC1 family protein